MNRSTRILLKNMATENSVFVDTSGWMALLHSDEAEHNNAIKIYDAAKFFITTNYVLAELVPLANSRGIPRQSAYRLIREIEASEAVNLVWVDSSLHESAMKLLEARLDKSYSLCDAVSFVVMREMGLASALTTDRHFEQEGLIRLL